MTEFLTSIRQPTRCESVVAPPDCRWSAFLVTHVMSACCHTDRWWQGLSPSARQEVWSRIGATPSQPPDDALSAQTASTLIAQVWPVSLTDRACSIPGALLGPCPVFGLPSCCTPSKSVCTVSSVVARALPFCHACCTHCHERPLVSAMHTR